MTLQRKTRLKRSAFRINPKLYDCANPECTNKFTKSKSNQKHCSKYCYNKEHKFKSSLKPVSDKQKGSLEKYGKLRKAYLIVNPYCTFGIEGVCTHKATEVHHKKRRGKYLLDMSTWMAGCHNCHQWAETHPKESREKGWIET